MLPTKFQVNWLLGFGEEAKKRCLESIGLLVQEKKQKIDFQDSCHGGHLGFPMGTILAFFDLFLTPMLPTMFGVNWLLGSGEEAKNRLSRWRTWRPSWIYDRHDFWLFLIYKLPQCFLASLESTGLSVQEKK